ncbi:hypothetical protein GIB67_013925 [Kingdonia uniflora]|uniref:Uncharacterized protein n=1 Tax=Kingdonia uniflora TaxID=39325 RepID=A0A7J7LDL3_9MAGN|nr:hypothetical protein GIB67_013925 [Kingdonia uniflora]
MVKAGRRKLKKGPISDTTANATAEPEEKHKENNLTSIEADKIVQKPPSGKPVHGQMGKLKEFKEKYVEQDDQERRICMALHASVGKTNRNDEESQDTNNPSAKEIKSATGSCGGASKEREGAAAPTQFFEKVYI